MKISELSNQTGVNGIVFSHISCIAEKTKRL